MRILIDATPVLLRSAGVKNYLYHWIRSLRAQAGGDEIRAFPYLDRMGCLDHEGSVISRRQTLPRLALLYGSRSSTLLDWIVSGCNVFHASNQIRRAPRGVKITATIHDLTCWTMPRFHTAANIQADRNFAEQVSKRADGLIAVSENTRCDAIRILGIAPEKIQTIYSGIADEYFWAKPTPRAKAYVLYVGTIEPRKNLDALLDAWREIGRDLRENFDLVIAGPPGWKSEQTLARIRAEATYLGYVPEADLPGLVAGASLFVYPSLYEGFGFPVVQVMAAGAPVVTSNNSCLPEVAGGAAKLIDPQSPAELASAINVLLESESKRAALAALGRERAKRFRWETCAAESLAFFRRISS